MQEADHEDHEALRRVRDVCQGSINKLDLDGLLAVVDEQGVFTGMDARACHGHGEIRAYFNRMFQGPVRVLDHFEMTRLESDRLTTLHDGHIGVATGLCTGRYKMRGGLDVEITSRWSCCLVKRAGEWKILSVHFSADVFDNPVLTFTRRSWPWVGFSGAVVGLALGWLWGRRS